MNDGMAVKNQMPVACFAPPLTDKLIAKYRQIAESLGDARGEIRDAMRECLKPIDLWWELDESKGSAGDPTLKIDQHRGQPVVIKVTSLDPEFRDQLFDAIPWPYEIDAMQRLFDTLPSGTVEVEGTVKVVDQSAFELRNAAFHLLWFARELCLDREPLTQEKLPD